MQELSDAEVFGAAPMQPAPMQAPAAPVGAPQGRGPIVFDGGHGISVEVGGDQGVGPQRPQAPASQELSDADVFGAPAAASAQPPPQKTGGPLDDIWDGFSQPLVAFGHQVMQGQRASLAPPKNLVDAAARMLPDPTLLGLPSAVGAAVTGAFTRPIAGQVAKVLPTPFQAPHPTMAGGKLGLTAPRAMDPTDAAQGVLDTALSGARPALPAGMPLGPRIALPPAPTLDELAAAKQAAYAKVDQSGFAFPQADVQRLAADIATEVATKAGPTKGKLYPASEAMADRLSAIAQQPGGVPLSQLDGLRADIWDALVAPGDRESTMGSMMRQKIDALMDAAQAPHIKEARAINTRLEKVKTVSNKLDSAGLRAASTYSGGNYNNAVRQSLRPLVDPDSPQLMRNLSPDENAALRRAVTGTKGQNATRAISKLLTNKIVQVPFGVLTHGVGNAVMEGAGSILNKVGEKQTGKAVQAVLDLMATGGTRAAPSAAALPHAPPVRVLSGPGLTGLDVLALPLRPTPDQVESARRSAKTKYKAQPQRP